MQRPVMNPLVRSRRLFVSGGSKLSANAALLWRELGKLLAAEDALTLITGGLQGMEDSPGSFTADLMIAEGFEAGLHQRGINPGDRLETLLPDPNLDWKNLRRFGKGHVQVLANRTAQSRRFRMVHACDVVTSIEGEKGTRSVLDVALAIERPILPLPFGGGASAEVWRKQSEEICESFQITPAEFEEFDRIRLGDTGETEIFALAARVRSVLLRGFTRRCFVIMTFEKSHDPIYENAIQPALKTYGLEPVRTDRHIVTGNIVEAIRDGLRHCYFAIADTTGDRPNVMYELGMAHAHDKPVILLRRHAADDEGLSSAPFDLRGECFLTYDDDLDNLRGRLEACILAITGRSPNPARHV